MLAAKLTTEVRSVLLTILPDRDLTVTQTNVRKRRESLGSNIPLN
jgi:hypothetical protein